WGDVIKNGFVVIPTELLRNQKKLGLDSGELIVLLQLLMSWWEVEKLPYLQTSTIASRTGYSRRTVQRHIEALENKGFLKRIWGKTRSNNERAGASYDLRDTVARVNAVASVMDVAATNKTELIHWQIHND
ncbi:MAG: helix-turn-helix domain-containing protein, partial [Nitrosomonadales bacterium]|nr:helix-turn-helix domain-containing protein [Nitrosomonadales bacterium]